jgi:hypothetical protein
MKAINLHDNVRLKREVSADVIGENRRVNLGTGSIGTVLLVHGPDSAPLGFEVEFALIPQEEYAIASVYPQDVELA